MSSSNFTDDGTFNACYVNACSVNASINASVSPSSSYPPIAIVYIFFEMFTGVLTIFANGLILVVLARERHLRTVTNYFVASLAFADFLVGTVGLPCAIASFCGIPRNFYGCLAMNSVIVILTQISIFGLLAIAVERFIAVRFPFRYHEYFDGHVAAVIIAASWVGALIVGLVPLAGWHPAVVPLHDGCTFTAVIDLRYMVYFNFLGCVLTPLVLIFVFYVAIFQAVRRHLRSIDATEIHTPRRDGVSSTRAANNRVFFKELRMAKWFGGVVALFAACWLPIHICNAVTLLAGRTNGVAIVTAIILSHANSAVNPVLYAYSNTAFKAATRNALHCRSANRVQDLDTAQSKPQQSKPQQSEGHHTAMSTDIL